MDFLGQVQVEVFPGPSGWSVSLTYPDGDVRLISLPEGYDPREDGGMRGQAIITQEMVSHMKARAAAQPRWRRLRARVRVTDLLMGGFAGWCVAWAILDGARGNLGIGSWNLVCAGILLACLEIQRYYRRKLP